jgi:low affinity Fe/Cu permease
MGLWHRRGFVAGWRVTGPIFAFSDTWQLVMNTISSIVTFLMVFLIQNAQNRDSTALQLKLDELIRSTEARNRLIGIERLSEPELESVREKVEKKRPLLTKAPPSLISIAVRYSSYSGSKIRKLNPIRKSGLLLEIPLLGRGK